RVSSAVCVTSLTVAVLASATVRRLPLRSPVHLRFREARFAGRTHREPDRTLEVGVAATYAPQSSDSDEPRRSLSPAWNMGPDRSRKRPGYWFACRSAARLGTRCFAGATEVTLDCSGMPSGARRTGRRVKSVL